jgi:hypothetical protein
MVWMRPPSTLGCSGTMALFFLAHISPHHHHRRFHASATTTQAPLLLYAFQRFFQAPIDIFITTAVRRLFCLSKDAVQRFICVILYHKSIELPHQWLSQVRPRPAVLALSRHRLRRRCLRKVQDCISELHKSKVQAAVPHKIILPSVFKLTTAQYKIHCSRLGNRG